ncbi:beta-ketoacyl synthase N-terminal-like domain-containing protein [Streptomyces sp. NPDC006233]|uniref:beta-ketoacyl synthase N-terminal-like domain-containing protein n=1 Tax=Streptomyces sp. NPDC006233 TaxID=3156735 RepID=UPI0033A8C3A1
MSAEPIAVVGLALRFPGARSVESFWENLVQSRESISRISDEDVVTAHQGDTSVLAAEDLVPAAGLLEGIEEFDADYFGYTAREAELMDPQQRLLLQAAVEAFEDAGYDPDRCDSTVGVFMGIGRSSYFLSHLLPHTDLLKSFARKISLFNDKDYAATHISHRLGLTGPSMSISTACSTSLVTIHQACKSLIDFECDVALAGGASINVLQRAGYVYQEGNIFSPDGHCRAFDADARGTVGGNGIGIVVLKRLSDAVRDGDAIRAVIRGSAVNNDGADKVGFTAPSVRGQAAVIYEALHTAGVSADSIGYVEAHGTGTALGDPVEVAALTEAFRATTTRNGYCALGSVKTNLGHLDTAAGVAGFIKAVLSVERGLMPPSLLYQRPHPPFDFGSSPFFVNTTTRPWPGDGPRRAGVSSFGMGGTNAHLILEQPPNRPTTTPTDQPREHILLLSAKTPTALTTLRHRLADHLRNHPHQPLPDIAHTLSNGRTRHPHRAAVIGTDHHQLATALTDNTHHQGHAHPDAHTVFLYAGQGSHHPGMGHALYQQEPVFRAAVDECAELARPHLGHDLRDLLYGPTPTDLTRTDLQQPALFTIQYAMTRQWAAWGVTPTAMAGHSLGELTAATIAGVWSLPDAIDIVCTRAALMHHQPPGAMLAVPLTPTQAQHYADTTGCTIAAHNTPTQTVLAGTHHAIQQAETALTTDNIPHHRLATSHAFHTPLMDQAATQLQQHLTHITHNPPKIPFISNPTGHWITDQQATDPTYWAHQLRHPVHYTTGITHLLDDHPHALILEPGPGTTALTLLAHHPTAQHRTTIATQPHHTTNPTHTAHQALATLWTHGINTTPTTTTTHKTPLPTYPFDTQRHWIDRQAPVPATSADAPRLFTTVFRSAPLTAPTPAVDTASWLIFTDASGIGARWGAQLRELGERVLMVEAGDSYLESEEHRYRVRPESPEDFERLCRALHDRPEGAGAWNVLYLWPLDTGSDPRQARIAALDGLVHLAQGVGSHRGSEITRIAVITRGLAHVHGGKVGRPAQGMALGPVKTLPLEYPSLAASVIDIEDTEAPVDVVVAEMGASLPNPFVAYRDGRRFIEDVADAPVQDAGTHDARLRTHGVYLITGGFGGIGSALATWLAENYQARLVLTGRTPLPPREQWAALEEAPGTDPALRHRMALIRRLESLGAQVHTESFDIADGAALSAALGRAEQQLGPIEGVVHSAGLAGGGLAQFQTVEGMRGVLAPKVEGTLALASALRDRELSFFAVFSSAGALLGSFGQVDYCAANAFLDSWAKSDDAPPRTLAIAWDAWRNLGMTSAERLPAVVLEAHADRASTGFSVPEALSAFERALAGGETSVVVSTESLRDRFSARAGGPRRVALPSPDDERPARSRAEVESTLISIWSGLFGHDRIERDANFFELGGDSLLIMEAGRQIKERLQTSLSVSDLFKYPTIDALAGLLAPGSAEPEAAPAETGAPPVAGHDDAIAVIGMAVRFPGANSVDEFWDNLVNGMESIVPTTDAPPARAGARGHHVAAAAAPDGVDQFDAAFFGISRREAEIMDPQQRLLLMCSYEALEDAGCDPRRHPGEVAVYVGTAMSSYLLNNLVPHREDSEIDPTFVGIGNDKDFAATQISYRLNLRGPSVSVSTACSTSLVAIAHACRSLASGDCDMTIAGGARVRVPERSGYWYQEGGITSPDGHCRAFDADARGTVFTSGAGVVVLKRLSDAVRDGDAIRAVIRGSAVNNDGADKVGFTAPSVRGQAAVIYEALHTAGVSADSIGYVEAHGTGTALGDPVEVAALTEAFRATTTRNGYCALGSVKTNLGHLDTAAGVAGFIKAVLSVERGLIPPSLHYQRPNPQIDFASSPFFVNTTTRPWPGDGPRRAGVSSFGMGGTNAHLILEQPPNRPTTTPTDQPREHILLLSAKTPTALTTLRHRLADHLRNHPHQPLPDIAHTLSNGRTRHPHRAAVIGTDHHQLATALTDNTHHQGHAHPDAHTVFLYAGQGSHHPGMGHALYQQEPVFRAAVDECAELARPHLGHDLRDLLYGPTPTDLTRTDLQQPALFTIQYAMTRQWAAWGVTPTAMAGHSLGELTAATIAGVWSLPDAIDIVCTRAALMHHQPPGAMLAVPLTPTQAQHYADTTGCTIAAHNTPTQTVLAGTHHAIQQAETALTTDNIPHHRLATSHAFHTPLMDQAATQLQQHLTHITHNPPKIPFISNPTGHWITDQQATDPTYWAHQLRHPVHYTTGITHLLDDHPHALILEPGPGTTALTLLAHHPTAQHRTTIATQPHHTTNPTHTAHQALATLWTHGINTTPTTTTTHKTPLPTYPFDTQRHWIDAPAERTAVMELPNPPVVVEAAAHQPAQPEDTSTPYDEPEAVGVPYAPPRTETEAAIVHIIEDVLGTTPIGIHDDFFDHGGDSFMALQILTRLTEQFGIDLPHQTVLEASTAAQLATHIPGTPQPARDHDTTPTTPHHDPTPYDEPEEVGVPYAPPRTETEAAIVHIIEDVLGTTPIGIHDDFFDHGGDSFMALQILTRLTEQFGIDLPHQTVLEASTAAQLATHIPDEQESEPTTPCLARLREGDERQVPLFLVHPVGGGLYFYKRLVRRLAPGQTVYGFQAAGLDGKSVPPRRVEKLAARYLRELRALRPEGPIALGGAAFGGLVALEMAQRLRAEGTPVHSLVLFDTPGPGQMPANRHGGLGGDAADELVASRLAEHGLPTGEDAMELARPVFEVYQANIEALHVYRPGTYAGSVLYFLAERRRPGIDPEHPDKAWAPLVDGEFAVHETPGDYAALFQDEASISIVAEILSDHLALSNGLRP